MLKLPVALIATGALALAGSSDAVTLVNHAGQHIGGEWQRWVRESLEPTVGGPLRLDLHIPRPCGDVNGCAKVVGGKVRVVYIRPTAGNARFALMHELGHAFDKRYLTPRLRHRFEYLDGWGHRDGYGYPAWSDHGLDSVGTPMEDFANTYASCAIYAKPTVWYMNQWEGWDSDWRSYREACRLIHRATRAAPTKKR